MAYSDAVKILDNESLFKQTSSLNNYYLCHHCGKRLKTKIIIERHLETCLQSRTCTWCNILFKNRGNLVRHAYYVHGDNSLKKPLNADNTCVVCKRIFCDGISLRSHIRSLHFNLLSKFTSYEDKKINQVWFERVHNSSKIVEMKKTGLNVFMIRKIEDDQKVTIQDNTTLVDLRDVYPTKNRNTRSVCRVCKKTMLKRVLKKHYDEKHGQLKKHHCNNCKKTFKRAHQYVRHICKIKRAFKS